LNWLLSINLLVLLLEQWGVLGAAQSAAQCTTWSWKGPGRAGLHGSCYKDKRLLLQNVNV